MCGRFTLHTEKELLARSFEVDLDGIGTLAPSYNVAPGQLILTVRQRAEGRVGERMKWGLVPRWSRPLEKLPSMINARVETIATRPAYREAFRERRCLVLADGFYEWQSLDRKLPATPHWISLASGGPFAMAGIWERWRDGSNAEPLVSCSIVTAPANRAVAMIHPRMPVILPRERAFAWIDPKLDGRPRELAELLEPVPAEALRAHAVSPDVNTPRNDEAKLIEPVDNPMPTLF